MLGPREAEDFKIKSDKRMDQPMSMKSQKQTSILMIVVLVLLILTILFVAYRIYRNSRTETFTLLEDTPVPNLQQIVDSTDQRNANSTSNLAQTDNALKQYPITFADIADNEVQFAI